LRSARRGLCGRRRQSHHDAVSVGIPLLLRLGDAARSDRRGQLGYLVGAMSGLPLLSLLIAVPLIGAALCLFAKANGARWIALAATLLDFALSIDMWVKYDPDGPQWQFVEKVTL